MEPNYRDFWVEQVHNRFGIHLPCFHECVGGKCRSPCWRKSKITEGHDRDSHNSVDDCVIRVCWHELIVGTALQHVLSAEGCHQASNVTKLCRVVIHKERAEQPQND